MNKQILSLCACGVLLLSGCDARQYSIVNVKDGGKERVFLLNDSDGATWIWTRGKWSRTTVEKSAEKADKAKAEPFDKEKFISEMLRYNELKKQLKALENKSKELKGKGLKTTSREYLELLADKIAIEEKIEHLRVSSSCYTYRVLSEEMEEGDVDFFGMPLESE